MTATHMDAVERMKFNALQIVEYQYAIMVFKAYKFDMLGKWQCLKRLRRDGWITDEQYDNIDEMIKQAILAKKDELDQSLRPKCGSCAHFAGRCLLEKSKTRLASDPSCEDFLIRKFRADEISK